MIPFLIHSVQQDTKLIEGDFFGVLGVLLLLSLLSFHDGIGLLRIIGEVSVIQSIDNPYSFANACEVDKDKIPLDSHAWVNAWSSKPFCMRGFLESQRKQRKEKKLLTQHSENERYFKTHNDAVQMRVLQGLSLAINEEESETINTCRLINALPSLKVKPASWMIQTHKDVRLCAKILYNAKRLALML